MILVGVQARGRMVPFRRLAGEGVWRMERRRRFLRDGQRLAINISLYEKSQTLTCIQSRGPHKDDLDLPRWVGHIQTGHVLPYSLVPGRPKARYHDHLRIVAII